MIAQVATIERARAVRPAAKRAICSLVQGEGAVNTSDEKLHLTLSEKTFLGQPRARAHRVAAKGRCRIGGAAYQFAQRYRENWQRKAHRSNRAIRWNQITLTQQVGTETDIGQTGPAA